MIDTLWVSARLRRKLLIFGATRGVFRAEEHIVSFFEVSLTIVVALVLSVVLDFSSWPTNPAVFEIVSDRRGERIVVGLVLEAAGVAVVQSGHGVRIVLLDMLTLVKATVVEDLRMETRVVRVERVVDLVVA